MKDAKKYNQILSALNVSFYGITSGLWKLFDETAFVAVKESGGEMLAILEQTNNVKIQAETPEEILQEVVNLLVNAVGSIDHGKVIVNGNKASIACVNCVLQETTALLEEQNIPPFACLPMHLSAAAVSRNTSLQYRLRGRDWNADTKTCTINFELL